MTVRPVVTRRTSTWGADAVAAARTLAVASWVGAVVGLVAGGVGGRLFMGLLARLNPEDHGVITSDGFPMGEVTLSGTVGLLLVGTALGVLGAGIYVGLRGLALGPTWFRRTCVAVGGTVMAGAAMVHEDGPDFTLLEPTWAAIALTLAVPLVFLLAMPPLVDAAVATPPRGRWVWIGLAPWAFPLFIVTPILVAGWAVARLVGRRPEAVRVGMWAARGALVAIFLGGAVTLGSEIAAIYDTVSQGRYLLG